MPFKKRKTKLINKYQNFPKWVNIFWSYLLLSFVHFGLSSRCSCSWSKAMVGGIDFTPSLKHGMFITGSYKQKLYLVNNLIYLFRKHTVKPNPCSFKSFHWRRQILFPCKESLIFSSFPSTVLASLHIGVSIKNRAMHQIAYKNTSSIKQFFPWADEGVFFETADPVVHPSVPAPPFYFQAHSALKNIRREKIFEASR